MLDICNKILTQCHPFRWKKSTLVSSQDGLGWMVGWHGDNWFLSKSLWLQVRLKATAKVTLLWAARADVHSHARGPDIQQRIWFIENMKYHKIEINWLLIKATLSSTFRQSRHDTDTFHSKMHYTILSHHFIDKLVCILLLNAFQAILEFFFFFYKIFLSKVERHLVR